MKIAHFISNLVFSFVSLLCLCALYTDYFGAYWLPKTLHPILDKIIGKVFSEHNILGLLFLYAICVLFAVLTLILFIKNLVKKQNATASVLSLISLISLAALFAFAFFSKHSVLDNSVPFRISFILNAILIIAQLIVSLIDTIKSYSIEYSE